jgi:hypothetical protein
MQDSSRTLARHAWLAAVVAGALALGTTAAQEPVDPSVCRLADGRGFVATATGVVSWPGGESVFETDEPVRCLACGARTLAVAIGSGRGELVVLQPDDAGAETLTRSRFRGEPVSCVAGAGAGAVVLEQRRGRGSVHLAASEHGEKGRSVSLPAPTEAVSLSPDERLLLVAQGRRLQTYEWPGGGSAELFVFPAAIERLVAGAGPPPRVIVAMGDRLVGVDPRDPPRRGVLPFRGQRLLPAPIEALAWNGQAPFVAVLFADPPRIMALATEDLEPLDAQRLDAPATSIEVQGNDTISWTLRGGGSDEWVLPESAIAIATERPAAVDAAPPSDPETFPEPRPGDPTEEPEELPGLGEEEEAEEQGNRAAAGGRQAPRREPPAPPAPPREQPPAPAEPADEPPPPRGTAPPLPERLPGGTIAGVLRGQSALVTEVVLLGPDSLLAEQARVAPERTRDGRIVYRANDLPAGVYRVRPMGRNGASLATEPEEATASVGADEGTRVDFEILRAW